MDLEYRLYDIVSKATFFSKNSQSQKIHKAFVVREEKKEKK